MLIYIFSRTIIPIFYNVILVPPFTVTDIFGFSFPVVLLFIYAIVNKKVYLKFKVHFLLMIGWVTIASLFQIVTYKVNAYLLFKQFFKILNALSVFLVFPLLFQDEEDIKKLINVFLLSLVFPVSQALAQFAFGQNVLGLKARPAGSDVVMFEGFYANVGVFGVTAIIGALCTIAKMGFVKTKREQMLFSMLFFVFIVVGLFTLSRMLLVNMVIIFLSFLFALRQRGSRTTLAFVLVLTFLFVSSSIFLGQLQGIIQRSESEIDVLQGTKSVVYAMHGRVSTWDRNWELFRSRYEFSEQLIGTDLSVGPHGDFAQWLFSYGIIGLLLYVTFFVRIALFLFFQLRRQKSRFYKYYGAMVLTGIFVWITTAIVTNPSMIPDYTYFIIGNLALFIAFLGRRGSAQPILPSCV